MLSRYTRIDTREEVNPKFVHSRPNGTYYIREVGSILLRRNDRPVPHESIIEVHQDVPRTSKLQTQPVETVFCETYNFNRIQLYACRNGQWEYVCTYD